MKIETLKLIHFRNYEKLEVTFHPTLNLIYGKNGSGKTNLVEGIYVLALTRSFRLVGDKTLILDGKEACKVSGSVVNRSKSTFSVLISKDGKKVKVDDNPVAKISDYIAKIPIVLFHPDDLRFIKDTPSTRRKTLNISISLMNLEYLKVLNQYKVLLKQRNAYLKQMAINGRLTSDYLSVLTEKLVDTGMYLYQKRKKYLEDISKYLNEFYKRISTVDGLKLEYISDYSKKSRDEILEMYEKNLQKDLSFGKTNLGVHTDDLRFLLKEKDLKEYGSEGQQKNAIIAYKFSELELFKEKMGSYPLFILDDLFSELDEEKVTNILGLLSSQIQTFITTTDLKHFLTLDRFPYKSFLIDKGRIVEEKVHGR